MRGGDAAALRQFLGFLRRLGVIPVEKVPPRRLTPVERAARAFEHYLRHERALARATCVNYVPFVRGFLTDRFHRGPVALSRLGAGDIVRFVQRQAPRLHLRRAKLLTSALRSFLRYARYRGAVTRDLAVAVPIVANWSMPAIPRAIGADQVRQLLASIDRHTAMGRRDYAIVLLLARLGLRAGEVAFLELDDLDWSVGIQVATLKEINAFELPGGDVPEPRHARQAIPKGRRSKLLGDVVDQLFPEPLDVRFDLLVVQQRDLVAHCCGRFLTELNVLLGLQLFVGAVTRVCAAADNVIASARMAVWPTLCWCRRLMLSGVCK